MTGCLDPHVQKHAKNTPDPLGPMPQSGLGSEFNKSELLSSLQQVFNFVGYHFDFSQGLVKATQERRQALIQKIKNLVDHQSCSVQQFISLIGLLTATEEQVISGHLQMRPIQWHLKNHWHVTESLEKIIPLPRSPSSL